MQTPTQRNLYPVAGCAVREADFMGHPRRKEADDVRPAQGAEFTQSRKDQPLSWGLSLLVWLVMAGGAWAVVALALRLA